MERLTVPAKKLEDGRTVMPIIDGRAVREHAMEFYWRLKEYEDLEEKGLLLRLHFGKGDVVYETVQGADGEYSVISRKCRTTALLVTLNEKVGKTVFLTKTEAEEALARIEGKDET